jgi:hypothetical protein
VSGRITPKSELSKCRFVAECRSTTEAVTFPVWWRRCGVDLIECLDMTRLSP